MSKLLRAALTGLAFPSILALAACGSGGVGSASGTPAGASPSVAAPSLVASEAPSAEPSAEASPSGSESGTSLNQAMLQFEAKSDSGITGGAILTDLGDGETAVTIGVVAIGFADPMPAHIYEGTCDDVEEAAKFPLTDVAVGSSNTVIDAEIEELTATPHALDIHKSAAEDDIVVACADITQ
jgi:hypothetical protein